MRSKRSSQPRSLRICRESAVGPRESRSWLLCLLLTGLLLTGLMPSATLAQELSPGMLEASRASGKPVFWGVVRDVFGHPIADAGIRLISDRRLLRESEQSYGLGLVSDTAGGFQDFSPAPASHAFRLFVSAAGYVGLRQDAFQIDGEPLEFVLETAAWVEGRIVDRDGHPVDRARWELEIVTTSPVLGSDRLDSGLTDPDGQFRAHGPPGRKVWVKAMGKGWVWLGQSEVFTLELPGIYLPDLSLDIEYEPSIVMPATADPTDQRIPPIEVRGRVVDPDGQPVAGATVQLYGGPSRNSWSSMPQQVMTDAEGRWRCGVFEAGDYWLAVEHEDRVKVDRRQRIEAEPKEMLVELEPSGVVRGEIHGLELRHFSYLELRVSRSGKGTWARAQIDRGPPATYSISGVPLTGARLIARVHNSAPSRDFGELVFDPDGSELRQDLAFEPGFDLLVRLDVDGAAMTDGSWIVACPERGEVSGRVYPIDGTFLIRDLDPARCTLWLDVGWPGEVNDSLGYFGPLWAVDTGEETEFALRTGRLSGRLVDRDGVPIAKVAVTLAPPDEPEMSLDYALTDDQGWFDFARVVAGRWLVLAAEPKGATLGSWPVEVKVDGVVEVELVLPAEAQTDSR